MARFFAVSVAVNCSAAALEAHRQSDHFKKHAVGGLYQKMRERALENLVALS